MTEFIAIIRAKRKKARLPNGEMRSTRALAGSGWQERQLQGGNISGGESIGQGQQLYCRAAFGPQSGPINSVG
jgi:hypothetical protein